MTLAFRISSVWLEDVTGADGYADHADQVSDSDPEMLWCVARTEQTNWCWNGLSVRFKRYAVLLDRAPVRTRKVGDCDGSWWSGWLEVKQRWFQWQRRFRKTVLLHTAALTTAQGLMLVGPPGCGKTMLVQVEKSLSIYVSTSKSQYHTNKTFHSHPLSPLPGSGSRQRDQGSTQAWVQDESTNK